MDGGSLTLVLTTVALPPHVSSCPVMSTGLPFLDGGMNRTRNVVIRAGERGRTVV